MSSLDAAILTFWGYYALAILGALVLYSVYTRIMRKRNMQPWLAEAIKIKQADRDARMAVQKASRDKEIEEEYQTVITKLQVNPLATVTLLHKPNVARLKQLGLHVERPLFNIIFGNNTEWEASVPYEP